MPAADRRADAAWPGAHVLAAAAASMGPYSAALVLAFYQLLSFGFAPHFRGRLLPALPECLESAKPASRSPSSACTITGAALLFCNILKPTRERRGCCGHLESSPAATARRRPPAAPCHSVPPPPAMDLSALNPAQPAAFYLSDSSMEALADSFAVIDGTRLPLHGPILAQQSAVLRELFLAQNEGGGVAASAQPDLSAAFDGCSAVEVACTLPAVCAAGGVECQLCCAGGGGPRAGGDAAGSQAGCWARAARPGVVFERWVQMVEILCKARI